MRICMFNRSMPAIIKGGMEYHTLLLAKGLVKRGHEVTVVTTRHPDGLEYENIEGVKIHYLPKTSSGEYSESWWQESKIKFEELQKETPFDVIHSQSAGAFSIIKSGLNRQYGVPVVFTFHGFSYDDVKNILLSGQLLVYPHRSINLLGKIVQGSWAFLTRDISILRQADALIAINYSMDKSLKELLPKSKNRVFLVYNGIDTEFFKPIADRSIRQVYQVKDDEVLLLTVSRLTKMKGIQNVIFALKNLQKKYKIKLVIVGKGDYRGFLNKLVENLGLQSIVSFAGTVPDEKLVSYFNSCDIFINLALNEFFPLTPMQAMACKKPTISSKIGDVSKVIDEGKDCLLVSPGDVKGLEKTLDLLLSRRDLMEQLSDNARAKVLSTFSIDIMVKKTVQVYEYVCDRRLSDKC
jgi:glycosyltransferase involved in cell wall biosynthesis